MPLALARGRARHLSASGLIVGAWARAFGWITAVLLCLTAAAKLVAVFQAQRVLDQRDAVFAFWTVREVLAVAAALELAVVAVIASKRVSSGFKLASILWLALIFLTYRFALYAVGFVGYCHCLGEWTEWMHLPQAKSEVAAKGLLAWLLIGSSALLAVRARVAPGRRGARCAVPESRDG